MSGTPGLPGAPASGAAPERPASQPGPAAGPPATSRRDWWSLLVPLGAALLAGLLFMLKLTTRRRMEGGGEFSTQWARGEPMIIAFWHEQLVMMPFVYRGPRVCVMVSRHRDGELIARAVKPLGIDAVRGSSTRGWAGALRSMLRCQRAGADLAFAVDGPRGPRRVAKSGVVQIARASGAPIVPVAGVARWCVRLRSWDRLVVPLPGTRITYVTGRPIRVTALSGPAALEETRATVERELERLTAEAAAAVAG